MWMRFKYRTACWQQEWHTPRQHMGPGERKLAVVGFSLPRVLAGKCHKNRARMSFYKINKNSLVYLESIRQSNAHCVSFYFVLSASALCRGGSAPVLQVTSKSQFLRRSPKSSSKERKKRQKPVPNSQVTLMRSSWVTSPKAKVIVHPKHLSIKTPQLARTFNVKHI